MFISARMKAAVLGVDWYAWNLCYKVCFTGYMFISARMKAAVLEVDC